MRIPKFRFLSQLSLALAAIAILSLTFAGPAQAAPTVRLFGGFTSVQLSEDLLGALGALNLTAGTVEPGALSDGSVRFPISGGALDGLKGDIFHVGGLSLTDDSGTVVELLNFIIDTTDDHAVLTGLVTANGDLVDRIPLFRVNLSDIHVDTHPFNVTIRGATLHLTSEAADALNGAFGVNAFEEGFSIGEAEIVALF